MRLDAFDYWMVEKNLAYIATEGLDAVVNRLRANGYPSVAAEVERQAIAMDERQRPQWLHNPAN